MAENTYVDEKSPEEIRDNIQETRESLNDKIEHLESNVHDAVEAAKEKLSPSHYINSYPWACLAASIGVGFVVGQMKYRDDRTPGNDGPGMVTNMASGLASSGLMMATTKFFGQEIRDLRNYAIAQALGVAKQLATGMTSPDLSPRVGRVFDRAASHFATRP
mgnify:CR=1 FL=1